MEFRIEPTPLSRRRSRGILATTGLVAGALAVFIGALTVADGRPDVAVAPAVAATASSAVASKTATAPPPRSARAAGRTGPAPRVVCHGVAEARCQAVAGAALKVSDDPALPWPSQVDVWASLLCGDFDCPPDRIAGRQALGSAVIMAGTVRLRVNVVGPATGSGTTALEAWVIRSGPFG